MSQPPLYVIPLGGLGEIGRNMMALEYDGDIVVIDAGLLFPDEDMPGIDFVIPDISYLRENRDRVRAILITHGHEDHTGALPWVLPDLDVPVYASRLTHGLITVKLREHGVLKQARLNVVNPYEPFKLGPFTAEFFRVCHSIPDVMGIALTTPVGLVVHTGDFKIDHTPVDGNPTDFSALARLTAGGVLLLCSDSTYAEVEGYTLSEQVVGEALDRAIGEAEGRVMVASFASLISRIQQVINAAQNHNRKVAVVGRSMINNVKMARNMGYLQAPSDALITLNQASQLPLNQVVIMATGSQGEPTSALVRVANGEHPDIEVVPGDTVIISASPIPGNETLVSRTIDNLYRRGAHVLYGRTSLVHVHGHASREELKMMVGLIKPRYFVPIHGEYRHLVAHAELAESVGVPRDNTFVLEDGDVLEVTSEQASVVDTVPASYVYVEGRRLWEAASGVLGERRSLSRHGVVVVSAVVNENSGEVIGSPKVDSSGFAGDLRAEDLLERTSQEARTALEQAMERRLEWDRARAVLAEAVGVFLQAETGRRPTVLALVERI